MRTKSSKRLAIIGAAGFIFCLVPFLSANDIPKVESNHVIGVKITSEKIYQNPFFEVTLDSLIKTPEGKVLRIPAFWAGENRWEFRYSSSIPGEHRWSLECSDKDRVLATLERF